MDDMRNLAAGRCSNVLKPEVEWKADGIVTTTIFFTADERTAEFAAVKCGEKLGLADVTVIHKQNLHPSEGTLVEIKGRVNSYTGIGAYITGKACRETWIYLRSIR